MYDELMIHVSSFSIGRGSRLKEQYPVLQRLSCLMYSTPDVFLAVQYYGPILICVHILFSLILSAPFVPC